MLLHLSRLFDWFFWHGNPSRYSLMGANCSHCDLSFGAHLRHLYSGVHLQLFKHGRTWGSLWSSGHRYWDSWGRKRGGNSRWVAWGRNRGGNSRWVAWRRNRGGNSCWVARRASNSSTSKARGERALRRASSWWCWRRWVGHNYYGRNRYLARRSSTKWGSSWNGGTSRSSTQWVDNSFEETLGWEQKKMTTVIRALLELYTHLTIKIHLLLRLFL